MVWTALSTPTMPTRAGTAFSWGQRRLNFRAICRLNLPADFFGQLSPKTRSTFYASISSVAKAVNVKGRFWPIAKRFGGKSRVLPIRYPKRRSRVTSRSKNAENLDGKGFFGERAGARTQDPVIKSHVLYRLSYALPWPLMALTIDRHRLRSFGEACLAAAFD